MIVGIILAAGKGTRINSKDRNKVTLPFLNKPLIVYSVELMEKVADKVIVVIGAFHESVKEALKNFSIDYAYQKKRLGTAHAVKVALPVAQKYHPQLVLVGYGDHTMFYQKENVEDLIRLHRREKAAMTIVTVNHDNSNLHWGYIIRNRQGEIIDSVEFKDADQNQKKIKELNAGFYCFDFDFLKKNIDKVPKSSVAGEYYLNSLIKIAAQQGKKVAGLKVPFSHVGIGVNRWQELEESQKLYFNIKKEK